MLYFLCYMNFVFYFPVVWNCLSLNFYFPLFWNWKQNGSRLMRLPSWFGSILWSIGKNVIPTGLYCRISDDSFTTNGLFLLFLFCFFFETKSIALSFFNCFFYAFFNYLILRFSCCIGMLYKNVVWILWYIRVCCTCCIRVLYKLVV